MSAYNPQFSRRTDWLSDTNSFTQAVSLMKSTHDIYFDLTISNPTKAELSTASALESVDQYFSDAQFYEPDPKGLIRSRESIAKLYHPALDPNDIFLTASTSEAYQYLFRLLTNPSDHILLPKPSYPLFQFLADINDLEVDFYSLDYSQGQWTINFDSLIECLKENSRAIIIVNPNNPTGQYLKEEELERLNQICVQYHLTLISDEVFWDFSLSDDKPVSCRGNNAVLTFVLNGLSKLLGLPQMKCSWLSVSGPQQLKEKALERLEILADTFLSVNTPIQMALPSLMQHREAFQKPISQRIHTNYEYLKSHASISDRLMNSEGGWYVVLNFSEISSAENWVIDLIKTEQVIVQPGYLFDFDEDKFVVMSLLPEESYFREGIVRMIKCMPS